MTEVQYLPPWAKYSINSSVPKYSILISTSWPWLRSIACWHIFSRSKGIATKSPGFSMSMTLHIAGSLQILRHAVQTFWALSRISIAPNLWSIFAVISAGRSNQFVFLTHFLIVLGLEGFLRRGIFTNSWWSFCLKQVRALCHWSNWWKWGFAFEYK